MSSERFVKDVSGPYTGFLERAMGIEPMSDAWEMLATLDFLHRNSTCDTLGPSQKASTVAFKLRGRADRRFFGLRWARISAAVIGLILMIFR
jgi:hypothetical protein